MGWVIKIYSLYNDYKIIKLFIIPLFIAIPPLLLPAGKYYNPLEIYFKNHQIMALCCQFWVIWIIIFQFINHFMEKYQPIDTRQALSLLEILENILGAKIERFGIEANKLLTGNKSPGGNTIFKRITQPEKQFAEIINGIWHFFKLESEAKGKKVKFRVALAKMGSRYIEEFTLFVPKHDGPLGVIEDYRVDNCGFTRAKDLKKILIIEDVIQSSKEEFTKSNYVIVSRQKNNENGSMICYPVYHRNLNDIPYVISVWVSEKHYFKLANEKTYDLIMNKFAQRIALEYGLLILKEGVK